MLGRYVAFMAVLGSMARRRKPAPPAGGFSASEIPEHLKVFDPGHWIGGSLYQREQAWRSSRREWVDKYQPVGLNALSEATLAPDEPLLDPYSV